MTTTVHAGSADTFQEAVPPAAMASWLPHMTSFCCCLGLEAGAKVIGVLHLLTALSTVVGCALFASHLHQYVGTVDDVDRVYSTWYSLAVAVTVISCVHVLLGGTLLYGTIKRHTGALRAWVLLMGVLYASSLLYILATSIVYGLASSGSDIFVTFLEGLVYFCVVGYCILCVNSYYMLVKSSEDMEGPKYNY